MTDLKKLFITSFLFLFITALAAQHKIGVRAGLNYSTWQGGELEVGEEIGVSSGFHFGVNYTYQFSPILGLRGELQYIQRGATYDFVDSLENTYLYIKPAPNSNGTTGAAPFFAYGKKNINLDVSQGYLSFPITVHYQPFKKLEFFGGASVELLLNPTGRGTVEFNHPEFFFRQSYDHKYRAQDAGEVDFFSATQRVKIAIDGQEEELYRTVSAYYDLNEADLENGRKYNLFDSNLIFGFNYFINSGFYLGVRAEYGLLDLSNDNLDFSARELNTDESYIKRSDSDRSRSASVSFGFRF